MSKNVHWAAPTSEYLISSSSVMINRSWNPAALTLSIKHVLTIPPLSSVTGNTMQGRHAVYGSQTRSTDIVRLWVQSQSMLYNCGITPALSLSWTTPSGFGALIMDWKLCRFEVLLVASWRPVTRFSIIQHRSQIHLTETKLGSIASLLHGSTLNRSPFLSIVPSSPSPLHRMEWLSLVEHKKTPVNWTYAWTSNGCLLCCNFYLWRAARQCRSQREGATLVHCRQTFSSNPLAFLMQRPLWTPK